MAFTPEDGTGVTGANAYGTVAGFRAYHTDRGRAVTDTDLTDAVVQQRLILGTDYIQTRWAGQFKGWPTNEDQGLHFPASGLCDRYNRAIANDAVPTNVEHAAYEYAFRASADLYNEPTVDATGGKVTGIRRKVGPLETETTFAEGTAITTIRPIPAADRLLTEFLIGGGNAGVIRN